MLGLLEKIIDFYDKYESAPGAVPDEGEKLDNEIKKYIGKYIVIYKNVYGNNLNRSVAEKIDDIYIKHIDLGHPQSYDMVVNHHYICSLHGHYCRHKMNEKATILIFDDENAFKLYRMMEFGLDG